MANWIAHIRRIGRLVVACIAAAHIGLNANAVYAVGLANRLTHIRAIGTANLRLITGVACAVVRCTAITVDAILLADRFANVRLIGREIARFACAGIRRATKTIFAFKVTVGRAEISVAMRWPITLITDACVRSNAESVNA